MNTFLTKGRVIIATFALLVGVVVAWTAYTFRSPFDNVEYLDYHLEPDIELRFIRSGSGIAIDSNECESNEERQRCVLEAGIVVFLIQLNEFGCKNYKGGGERCIDIFAMTARGDFIKLFMNLSLEELEFARETYRIWHDNRAILTFIRIDEKIPIIGMLEDNFPNPGSRGKILIRGYDYVALISIPNVTESDLRKIVASIDIENLQ